MFLVQNENDPSESHHHELKAPDPLLGLLPRIAAGDRAAVRSLIVAVAGGMLRTIRKVLGSHHPDVEDVAQEAVLGLIRSLPNFRGQCTVAHFANQVALRQALHARRHFVVRDRVGELGATLDDAEDPNEVSPQDLLLARERRRIVREQLGALSEQVAESLAMHFVLGYTVQQIADTLQVSPHTVWSRLKLGKKSLKMAFEQDERFRELLGRGSSLRARDGEERT